MWHLSREISFLKRNKQSVMFDENVRANKAKDYVRDELIWGLNSACELATVYYYTRRSIRGGGQSTPSGDKGWCIIAPTERYSDYRHFQ